jgi:hypothetical protein
LITVWLEPGDQVQDATLHHGTITGTTALYTNGPVAYFVWPGHGIVWQDVFVPNPAQPPMILISGGVPGQGIGTLPEPEVTRPTPTPIPTPVPKTEYCIHVDYASNCTHIAPLQIGAYCVEEGTSVTFTVTCEEGTVLYFMKVDDVHITPVPEYTFSNIAEDHTFWAYCHPGGVC